MRLVVTWAFVLFAMVMAGRMLLAITEAVEAVAGYVEVNPYVVAGRK